MRRVSQSSNRSPRSEKKKLGVSVLHHVTFSPSSNNLGSIDNGRSQDDMFPLQTNLFLLKHDGRKGRSTVPNNQRNFITGDRRFVCSMQGSCKKAEASESSQFHCR